MRLVPLSALLFSAAALSACIGGGGGGGFSAPLLAANGDVCGINDARPECNPAVDPATGGGTSGGGTSGGGTSGGGTSGGVGSGTNNQGNNTRLTTGDKTIIIEKSTLKMTEANPGLSKITVNATGTAAQIEIDTKQSDEANAKWPKAKTLAEYPAGTHDDTFNMGAGSGYREYRAYEKDVADEVLQLWSFNGGQSHIAQYRNLTEGGEAGMQAWTFGGKNKGVAMPTGGTVNYTGRYGATAKTDNWITPDDATITTDNLWSITGRADATADFGNDSFVAKLTPESWEAVDKQSNRVQVILTPGGGCAGSVLGGVNDCFGFMTSNVYINGTISSGGDITGSANINTVADADANNSPDTNQNIWLNSQTSNPFYGAFFGAGAAEAVGVFSLDATAPDPIGGDNPINDDRRGFISMSGALHVQ